MRRVYPSVPLPAFADELEVGECTAYRWAKRNLLPVKKGIATVVPGNVANRILRDWNRSCTQSEAARFLGLGPTRIGTMLAEKHLQGIELLGKTRILLTSLEKALFHPAKKRRFNSQMAREAARIRWQNAA
jgi:hypothetical protein